MTNKRTAEYVIRPFYSDRKDHINSAFGIINPDLKENNVFMKLDCRLIIPEMQWFDLDYLMNNEDE